MPRPFPPEFRQKAVELARERAKPIREIAGGPGIAESCLRRWIAQDDIDAGRREGLSRDEREELVRLRRENRFLRWRRRSWDKPRPSSPPRMAIGRAELPADRRGEGQLSGGLDVQDPRGVSFGVL